MNEYDSYRMLKLLESSGYTAAASYDEAVSNTAQYLQRAREG